ncbi:Uu.00g037000.m01.CDS01 [Anthostomella pinea]|uniref:Uu.00g037000.m01.CDS01 n=1 Tax=Anthostomella pinea TaxID=933095 RepID=A0AAI8VA64_9PEZI|nr:Uu.00g037000.m01.CDS01 [Anthostomella pinea]
MTSRISPVLFLDGGLGTSLEDKYRLDFSKDTPLWSSHLLVTDPETLRSCQRDFGQVPVDILLTATYQISVEAFARTETPTHPNGIRRSDIPSFLDLAVSIAGRVKAPSASIALSLGPYGATMIPSQEYSGRYDVEHDSVERLVEWHCDRLGLFAEVEQICARVDFLAFETVPRLDEIRAIRKLFARRPSSPELADNAGSLGNMPYWISCVFPGDDYTLPDGSSVDQVIGALLDSENADHLPWGIGINCTRIAKIPQLVRMYESAVCKLASAGQIKAWPSLVLYPDGTNGEVYDTVTKAWQAPDRSAVAERTGPW